MTLRAHHLVLSLFAGAIALGSLAVLTVNPSTAQAACASGSSVVVTFPGTATTNPPQSGIITLRAQSTPIAASGLSFMLISPNQQSLGEATQTSTAWQLSWDTRNQPTGTYQLLAIAHFGTATSLDCPSAAVPIFLNNIATQSPALSGTIAPATWQGPVGASAPFALDTIYTDQYGRLSHVSPAGVNWHSVRGPVAPNGGSTTVFKAESVGTGTLLADLTYRGIYATAATQIKVVAPTSSTTTATPTPAPTASNPTPTPSTQTANPLPAPAPQPVSSADATRLAAMPTIFRPTAATNSDPIVNIPTLSCLEKALGAVRFSEISSGKSSPTAAERKLSAACFSGPEPIPAVLAPVAPANLTDLATTTDIVSLASVKNHTTTAKDGKQVKGLLLSGTGAPNTSIFIYVFSDPLVLRAQTDSQGAWKYVLDTPLKNGKHEVYAVAEKDAGNFVRTSAVPITIATAATGAQDGTLVIENKFSAVQIGFAAGAMVLVLAAIGVLFTILRRRKVSVPTAGPVQSVSSGPAAPGPLPGLVQPSAPVPPAPAATFTPTSAPFVTAPPVAPTPSTPATAQSIPAAPTPQTPVATPPTSADPTDHDPQA